MITHVVMFRLHAASPENIDRARASIESLRMGIDGLRSLEVGVDFARTPLSYDLVATARFDDRASLEAYSKHPRHRAVLTVLRELSREVAVVDYESGAEPENG
jgi:hypothetical protein